MFIPSPGTGASVSTVEVSGEMCSHQGIPIGHKEQNTVNVAGSHGKLGSQTCFVF